MKTFALMTLLWLISTNVYAEAYCSLRDPTAQIRQLFPQKSNQLSIVREVDESTRKQVHLELPRNDLHFSELGKHTLYVAMANDTALGYVHVRSEQSPWGLVEIVWALNTDLTIRDFAFQRCRSPKRKIINDPNFKNIFVGKNLAQLKSLLNSDGVSANEYVVNIAKDAPELANVVLRCALKTLLITDVLWGQELSKYH